jgi:hypothetical protein
MWQKRAVITIYLAEEGLAIVIIYGGGDCIYVAEEGAGMVIYMGEEQ